MLFRSAAAAAASEGMRPVCELELGHLGGGDADRLADAAGSGALVLRLVSDGDGPTPAVGWSKLLPNDADLKIVSPATAADAKGLLISAVRDPDPVCFVESRGLYSVVCDGVPEGSHTVALGDARLVGQGTEIVVLAHGAAAVAAQRVAGHMQGEVGVVDLRSLRPLDYDAVTSTVKQTGKVLIAEQPDAEGLAPALAELIYQQAPQFLDAPIRELNDPPPQSFAEWTDSLEDACRELVAF